MRPASALAAAKSILEGRGDARYKRSSSLLNSGSAALACAEVVLAGVRPLKAAPPTTAAITVVSRYCLHSRGHGHDLAPFNTHHQVRGMRWPVVNGQETR
jgi:hypothetical protein